MHWMHLMHCFLHEEEVGWAKVCFEGGEKPFIRRIFELRQQEFGLIQKFKKMVNMHYRHLMHCFLHDEEDCSRAEETLVTHTPVRSFFCSSCKC